MSKDLPESESSQATDKLDPQKNCGNCVGCPHAVVGLCCNEWKGVPKFDPKPAEPQSWEQRFDKEFGRVFVDAITSPLPNKFWERTEQIKAFIRAEIDRAWGDGFKAGHDIAEENRSNE